MALTKVAYHQISSHPETMPTQTSQSGKYLTTDGSNTSWGTVSTGVDGIVSSADATAITIDSLENVGIGVVPESGWHSTQWDALQVGLGSAYAGYATGAGVSGTQMSSNVYATLGSSLNGYKYINNEAATTYLQYDGHHYFRVASSGTADSAISWTTAMTIENDGTVRNNDWPGDDSSGGGWELAKSGSTSAFSSGGTVLIVNRFASDGEAINFKKDGGTVGSISVTAAATAYNTSSDYRLKENIVPMSGSIDRLKALNPSRFNFISDPDKTVDGFLAHEAGEVVPECATGEKDAMKTEEYEVTPAVEEVRDDDGNIIVEAVDAVMGEREVIDPQGIDQSKLVPLLTASILELISRVESLETQLAQ